MVVTPEESRIGRATRGPLAGCVVLLEPYSEGAWLLYWVDPRIAEPDRELGKDVGDRLIPTPEDLPAVLDEELAVVWSDEREAESLRREFFSHEEPISDSLLHRLFGRGRKTGK
ncbi:hypothetical protein [Streptomyces sp. NPDC059874]|uniref:hypothetical protein n=1 Tax=Streptomyces sp. NPDC059874 TaxID=3346983 RepID=UPI0036563D6D